MVVVAVVVALEVDVDVGVDVEVEVGFDVTVDVGVEVVLDVAQDANTSDVAMRQVTTIQIIPLFIQTSFYLF